MKKNPLDCVPFVLDKKHLVNRGPNVDLKTLGDKWKDVKDPEKDVRELHLCYEMRAVAEEHHLDMEEDLSSVKNEKGLWTFGAYAHMVPIIHCPYCGKKLAESNADDAYGISPT